MHINGIIVPLPSSPTLEGSIRRNIYVRIWGWKSRCIKIYGLVCTKRKCTKCCHTESRFKEILCKYVLCTTLGVDGHTASFEVMVTMLHLTSFVWKRPTRKKNGYALGKSPACKSSLHTAETKGCEKVEEVKKLVGLCFLSPEARSVEHSPAAYEFLKSLRPTKCVNNVGKRIIFSNVTGEGVEMECCFTHFRTGVFGQILWWIWQTFELIFLEPLRCRVVVMLPYSYMLLRCLPALRFPNITSTLTNPRDFFVIHTADWTVHVIFHKRLLFIYCSLAIELKSITQKDVFLGRHKVWRVCIGWKSLHKNFSFFHPQTE